MALELNADHLTGRDKVKDLGASSSGFQILEASADSEMSPWGAMSPWGLG